VEALVIVHETDSPPGHVGERLEHHGFALTEAHIGRGLERGPDLLPSLDGFDLVVSLGCTAGVYERDVAAWMDEEIALLTEAHRRRTPVLGICFGGQSLAAALGAKVERAAQAEIGWITVQTDDSEAISSGPWLAWHIDRFELPAGATEIARTQHCSHAYRLDRSVGLQFHPEIDESLAEIWAKEPADEYFAGHGARRSDLLDNLQHNASSARVNAFKLVDWFIEVVASG
jgi:GMP synthase-like glutamine amidotransferase